MFAAQAALEGLLARVGAHVQVQVLLRHQDLVADVTLVRGFARVPLYVGVQVGGVVEALWGRNL